MPILFKRPIILFLSISILSFPTMFSSCSPLYNKGIDLYYVRYDIKTSRHKIVDTNLIMVPSEKEFRAEKFSIIQTYGAISAICNDSEKTLIKFARKNAIISLLRNNGLCSVQSKDYDIVVSYEGVIMTPVIILEKGFDKPINSYFIKIQTKFSPIAFPDKWKHLKTKSRIKNFFTH